MTKKNTNYKEKYQEWKFLAHALIFIMLIGFVSIHLKIREIPTPVEPEERYNCSGGESLVFYWAKLPGQAYNVTSGSPVQLPFSKNPDDLDVRFTCVPDSVIPFFCANNTKVIDCFYSYSKKELLWGEYN